jgi:hypothetical protein
MSKKQLTYEELMEKKHKKDVRQHLCRVCTRRNMSFSRRITGACFGTTPGGIYCPPLKIQRSAPCANYIELIMTTPEYAERARRRFR